MVILIFQCPYPFFFAGRAFGGAILGHEEHHALASANGGGKLVTPILARFQIAFIEPRLDERGVPPQGQWQVCQQNPIRLQLIN
jgi:hypothetical protein